MMMDRTCTRCFERHTWVGGFAPMSMMMQVVGSAAAREVVQLAAVGGSWRNLSGGGSDGTGKPLGLNNGNAAEIDP
jgi:hypothetical protein